MSAWGTMGPDPKIGDLVRLSGFGPTVVVMIVLSAVLNERALWCQGLSNKSIGAWRISIDGCRIATDEEAIAAIRRMLRNMGY